MIQKFVKPNNMTPLTIFGLFAVTAMLVFYALEKRSPWFVLAFASSCLLGSAYGFLQVRGRSELLSSSGLALQCDVGG